MRYFRLITFGCKVNQHDSAAMAGALRRRGFEPAPAGTAPHLVLVNTCTVTARADQEARQTIRRWAREAPAAALWVTGCYAQRAPDEVAALPGVKAVLGNQEKARLPEWLAGFQPMVGPGVQVGGCVAGAGFAGLLPLWFPGHTRAFLKVQEGCNHRCAYCIVPAVRGPSRSLAPERAAAALGELGAAGFQEVVLTGIDLGQYGRDLKAPTTLAALLRNLAALEWPGRLRLSSLEPQGVTSELLEALSATPRLCPHFHLPLQSGAASVLTAMGRPYGPEDVRGLAWELSRRFPEAALGLDVLVGFPGESDRDFAATWELVTALPVAYLHVFPFSPRPGTPAGTLSPLPREVVRRRAAALREWGQRQKMRFSASQIGKIGEVLVERPARQPGWLRGVSANYLKVVLPGPREWVNRRLLVRYTSFLGEELRGEVVAEVAPEG